MTPRLTTHAIITARYAGGQYGNRIHTIISHANTAPIFARNGMP